MKKCIANFPGLFVCDNFPRNIMMLKTDVYVPV